MRTLWYTVGDVSGALGAAGLVFVNRFVTNPLFVDIRYHNIITVYYSSL